MRQFPRLQNKLEYVVSSSSSDFIVYLETASNWNDAPPEPGQLLMPSVRKNRTTKREKNELVIFCIITNIVSHVPLESVAQPLLNGVGRSFREGDQC